MTGSTIGGFNVFIDAARLWAKAEAAWHDDFEDELPAIAKRAAPPPAAPAPPAPARAADRDGVPDPLWWGGSPPSAEVAETYRSLWSAYPFKSRQDAHHLAVLASMIHKDDLMHRLAELQRADRPTVYDDRYFTMLAEHRQGLRVSLSELGITPDGFVPVLPTETKK